MKSFSRACAIVVLAATFPCAAASPIYFDTTPNWIGASGYEIFGDVAYAYPSCGQTFVAPSGANVMQSVTFWLNDRLNPDPVRFTANLVAWDGTEPTGPILFTSAAVSSSNNHGLGGQEAFQFAMPDVPVVSANQYLAFLTSIDVSGALVGSAYVGVVSGDALPGGQTYVNYLATTIPGLFQQPWWFLQPSTDLAFRAQFALIPEPGATQLVLAGFGVLAAGRITARRRE